MTMQINRQALRSIIPDEARLLFAEQIPPEYQSDALGRRTGIGISKRLYFLRETPKENLAVMNRIKTALDPKHILNDQKSYIVGGK